MFRRYFLIVTLGFAIQACSFKKDGSDDKSPAANNTDVIETIKKEQEKQAFAGQLTEQNVSVNFYETERPGIYKMILQWPSAISRMQIIVNEGAPVIKAAVNSHEETVASDRTYRVSFLAYDSLGAPMSSLTIEKIAPKDYVVDGIQSLKKDTLVEANRIFFLPSSQIISNGYNLSLITKKLIILDNSSSAGVPNYLVAQVLTRLPTAKIETDLDKRQSSITIQADKAVGVLKVALVGANGNDGRSGQELEQLKGIQKVNAQLNGPAGADGVLGWTTKSCPKRFSVDGPPCEKEIPLCQKAPTNGGDGLPGEAGHDGENGEDGGPTGSLTALIKDHSSFSLEVIQMAGKPGKGGQGAPGHPGGRGGDPGKNPGSPCANAQRGSDGPVGVRGADGKDGKPGLVGEVLHSVERIKIIQL